MPLVGRPHLQENGYQPVLNYVNFIGVLILAEYDFSRLKYFLVGHLFHYFQVGLIQIMKYVRNNFLEGAAEWGALDCVECGCCQYSCPANIPLVHWIRLGKNKIFIEKKKKSA